MKLLALLLAAIVSVLWFKFAVDCGLPMAIAAILYVIAAVVVAIVGLKR